MNVGLSSGPSHQRRYRRLLKIILLGIVALLAFYPLTGCTSLQNKSGATPTLSSTPESKVPRKLVWSDEFDGPKGAPPDPSKWTVDVGGSGWGNNQLDYDTNNQNASQDGQGNLVIEARKTNSSEFRCWYGPCQYTSARITTNGHFSFTYGRLEARIKIPYGQGIWSAFWLFGDNCAKVGWPKCGEIDVMENIGREPTTIHGTVHGPRNDVDYSGTYDVAHGAASDDFHVYALEWDPAHLYFFVDGINYYTFDKITLMSEQDWVYDHPFSIVLNLAVGGTWPKSPNSTTVFPQKMSISYVRVYKE